MKRAIAEQLETMLVFHDEIALNPLLVFRNERLSQIEVNTLPILRNEYLNLVDWTERRVLPDKLDAASE